MDSDDEMMFHQITEDMSTLELDDQENEEVVRILVAAVEEEETEPKHECYRPGHMLLFNDYFAHEPIDLINSYITRPQRHNVLRKKS